MALLPSDGLHSAGRVHPNRRLGALGRNGSDRGSARTSPGRLGFADSAFEKSDFDITLIFHDYQFNISSLLEVRLPPDFRRLSLPRRTEFLHQHNVVRVPHGNRKAAHFRKCELQGQLIFYLGLADRDFEFIARFAVTDQRAGMDVQLVEKVSYCCRQLFDGDGCGEGG